MAGLNIEITIEQDSATPALQRLFESGRQLRPPLAQIGEHLIRSHRQRFDDQVGPEGNPWTPLSQEYLASKRKRESRGANLIMILNGYLSGLVPVGPHYEASDTELLFGTNIQYAAAQHFGRPEINLPPRPWLGISDGDERAITDIINDYLTESFNGG